MATAPLKRKPTATFIGQSTIKITNSVTFAGNSKGKMIPFMTFAQTVADAIVGARPQVTINGTQYAPTCFTFDTDVIDTQVQTNTPTIKTAGSFVVGNYYQINDLGITTSWTTIGVPNTVTPFVGLLFKATGAGTGDGKAIEMQVSNVNVANLVKGKRYIIKTPGTTDFTTLGAADSVVDTAFVSTTNGGAGTGVVLEIISSGINLGFSRVASRNWANSDVEFKTSPNVVPQLESGWELYTQTWGYNFTTDNSYKTVIDYVEVNGTNLAKDGTTILASTSAVNGLVKEGQSIIDGSYPSPIFTQVYRSLNVDGVSYKWLIVRYNVPKMEINTTTCEYWVKPGDWDPQANMISNKHICANEAYTFMDSAPVGYNLTNCDLLVMVSQHWCVFHSYVNDEPSLWSGVFESAREDVLDTPAAGNPCWGWMGSTTFLLGASNADQRPLNGTDHTLWSMPRTHQGYTGIDAAKSYGADYGATFHPHWLGTNVAAFIYYLGSATNKFTTSGWDATRKLAMPIKPISDYTSSSLVNYGGIFGVKVLAPAGANMNKIIVPTDLQGNASPTGADRFHWLLNCHFKRPVDQTDTWAGNTTWAYTGFGANTPANIISIGCFYYVMTDGVNNKIVRINAANTVAEDVIAETSGNKLLEMKYDGERYIYVVSDKTTSPIIKIDTTIGTAAASAIRYTGSTIGNGLKTLTVTRKHIIVGDGSNTIQPKIYRFKRDVVTDIPPAVFDGSALEESPGISVTNPVSTTAIKLCSAVTDFNGDVWFSTANDVTLDDSNRVIKLAYRTNASGVSIGDTSLTALAIANLGYYGGAVTTNNVVTSSQLQVLDISNIINWQAQNAAASMTFTQFRTDVPIDGTVVGTVYAPVNMKQGNELVSVPGLKTTVSTNFSVEKIDGICVALPRNISAANGGTSYNPIFSLSLGRYVTSSKTALAGLVKGADQYQTGTTPGLLVLCGASNNSCMAFDGARIFGAGTTNLKVWTNVHGGNNIGGQVSNTTTIGQVAIPA